MNCPSDKAGSHGSYIPFITSNVKENRKVCGRRNLPTEFKTVRMARGTPCPMLGYTMLSVS